MSRPAAILRGVDQELWDRVHALEGVQLPMRCGRFRVAAVDVTGDGRPEILTGQGPLGQPIVLTFDGLTAVELNSFFAFPAVFRLGIFVAGG